jgi:hypothetical protein
MVQFGLNMGPRHARTFGWAKSYTKRLSDDEKRIHDGDVIGCMSLAWALIKTHVPADIVTHVIDFLNTNSYPQIGTRSIPSGMPFIRLISCMLRTSRLWILSLA